MKSKSKIVKFSLTLFQNTKIDECKRLWVLDTGYIGDNSVCSPQLLVFDLNTDQLIQRYRIPKDQLTENHLLVNLVRRKLNDVRSRLCYLPIKEKKKIICNSSQHNFFIFSF